MGTSQKSTNKNFRVFWGFLKLAKAILFHIIINTKGKTMSDEKVNSNIQKEEENQTLENSNENQEDNSKQNTELVVNNEGIEQFEEQFDQQDFENTEGVFGEYQQNTGNNFFLTLLMCGRF